MNHVSLMGRITKDLVLKNTNESSYCNFSVAVEDYIKDGDNHVNFFNVTAWGKNAENIEKYFSKGDRILLEGRLRQNRYEKDGKTNYSVQVVLQKFNFIETKNSKSKTNGNVSNNNETVVTDNSSKEVTSTSNDDEDELPF